MEVESDWGECWGAKDTVQYISYGHLREQLGLTYFSIVLLKRTLSQEVKGPQQGQRVDGDCLDQVNIPRGGLTAGFSEEPIQSPYERAGSCMLATCRHIDTQSASAREAATNKERTVTASK